MGWNHFPQLDHDELILSFRGEPELPEPLRTTALVGRAAVCNLNGSFKETASCEGSKGAQGGRREKGLTEK